MFSVSKSFCSVFNQTTLKVNYKNWMKRTLVCPTHRLWCVEGVLTEYETFRTKIKNMVNEYNNETDKSWKEILNLIEQSAPISEKSNIISAVLNTCARNNLTDKGISFSKYILNSNAKLSLVDYTFMLKLLAQTENEIGPHEDLVRKIYEKIKNTPNTYHSLNKVAAEVFGHFRDLWEEIHKDSLNEEVEGAGSLAKSAFSFNEIRKGFRILRKNPKAFHEAVVESYFNYCLEMAKAKKFSSSMIDTLINYCQEKAFLVPSVNVYENLRHLVSVLNNTNTNIQWTVHKSSVKENICEICKLKLRGLTFGENDFKLLKNKLLDDLLMSNINLRSNESELKNFLTFLEKCRKYDIVGDGLNMFSKNNNVGKFVRSFYSKNVHLLLIGKSWLKAQPLFKENMKYFSYYFIDSLSDDDVFVLLAALHGGPSTFIISKDFYRGYPHLIKDPKAHIIFRKWLLSHQLLFCETGFVTPACKHGMLSQKTLSNKNKHEAWHISYYETANPSVGLFRKAKWICLKAKVRDRT